MITISAIILTGKINRPHNNQQSEAAQRWLTLFTCQSQVEVSLVEPTLALARNWPPNGSITPEQRISKATKNKQSLGKQLLLAR